MSGSQKFDKPGNYQVKVGGHFDHSWSDWFEGMAIKCMEDGTSLITGYIPDQSALYGLINRIQNMGIILISVIRIE